MQLGKHYLMLEEIYDKALVLAVVKVLFGLFGIDRP